MRNAFRSACMVGLLALPLGCAPTTASEGGELGVARERWEKRAPEAYRFDYQKSCFCVREQVQPVTIEVRDGRVVGVVARETGDPVTDPRLQWPTIDGLFREITELKRSGIDPFVVRYDATLGYPTYVEAGTLANDAGVIHHVHEVRPLK